MNYLEASEVMQEGKRVVILRSNPIDPDPRVEKEADALARAGYRVTITAWDRGERYQCRESALHLKNSEIPICRFGIPATYGGGFKRNLAPLLRFQVRLRRWLRKNRESYDIIHACDFDTAYTASKCARRYGKKFIYDIFDYYADAFNVPRAFRRLIESRDRKIMNEADGVILCTEKRLEQIQGSTPKRTAVIHNTPERIERYAEQRRIITSGSIKAKVVYAGILGEGRMIRETIRAMSKRDDCEYHVAGFGPMEETVRKAAQEYPNVFFYGKIPYPDVLALEEECDIMTAVYDPRVPNHKYAAPNKFYEALMLGKPLITARGTGIDEIIASHSLGEAMEYDEGALDGALTKLILRKTGWPDIARRGKELYNERYSWEIMEERLLQFYGKIGQETE